MMGDFYCFKGYLSNLFPISRPILNFTASLAATRTRSKISGFCALGAHLRSSATLKSRNSKWLPLVNSEMRSPISLPILDRATLLGRDFQRQYYWKLWDAF